jgi:hypothetical protein
MTETILIVKKLKVNEYHRKKVISRQNEIKAERGI